MTIPEWLGDLGRIKESYRWFLTERNEIRAVRADKSEEDYSPLTAYCEVVTGQYFDPWIEWDQAASALWLSLEQGMQIILAEDLDPDCDRALAAAIRQALGL